MDRETVITHLQIIHTWAEFARERDLQFFTAKHLEDIAQWADDALNLLKEQEALLIVRKWHKSELGDYSRLHCPKCDHEIEKPTFLKRNEASYCPYCGQVVKWK